MRMKNKLAKEWKGKPLHDQQQVNVKTTMGELYLPLLRYTITTRIVPLENLRKTVMHEVRKALQEKATEENRLLVIMEYCANKTTESFPTIPLRTLNDLLDAEEKLKDEMILKCAVSLPYLLLCNRFNITFVTSYFITIN